MKAFLFFSALSALLFFSHCRPLDRRITGAYKTADGDTLKLVPDHSFKIELVEPDTTLQQFKFATGRWHRVKRKVHFQMDSRDMGQYWECQPFRIGWRKLRRPESCTEGGSQLVFRKVKITHRKTEKREKAEEKEKVKEEKRKQKENQAE